MKKIQNLANPIILRSINSISTAVAALVMSDCAGEQDASRIQDAGRVAVEHLAGQFALAMSKESVRYALTNTMRVRLHSIILNASPQALAGIDQAATAASRDNADLIVYYIENLVKQYSNLEVESTLTDRIRARQKPFHPNVVSKPTPYHYPIPNSNLTQTRR